MAGRSTLLAATSLMTGWTALLAPAPAAAQYRDSPPVIMAPMAPAVIAPAPQDTPQLAPIRVSPIRAMRVPVAPVFMVRPETEQVVGKIIPPIRLSNTARVASVTLAPASHDEVMHSLRVTRQYSAARIAQNPVVMLGRTRVDLTPVLTNPDALTNVAARIHQFPALAEVTAEELSVNEVEQGLIIRQFLSYRIRPGACAGRASLGRVNIPCFVPSSPRQRIAAFSNPDDPHFVADPDARATALAEAEAKSATLETDFAKHVADLRAMLASPTERARMDAEVGPEEAARLAALPDDQLTEEVINDGETKLEQVMFVPNNDSVDAPPPPAEVAAPEDSADVTVDTPLPDHILITGFTLGRKYEWKKRIEKTIKWCLIDCSQTYYAEIYAKFTFGFGLRFPLKLGGTYHYARHLKTETATLTPTFEPVDGTAADYASAGLASDQLFDGQELVAEVGADAGMGYNLPGVGGTDVGFGRRKDFTADLPAPFTHGQFRPPAPGESNLPEMTEVFTDFDLIGGLANFGIVGGQIFPMVKVALSSKSLTFKMTDLISHNQTLLTETGTKVALAIDPTDHSSRFSLGDPLYNLGFTVTPGVDARIFLDLALWSNHWDWQVWFPQLSIELPPGGVDFACHADTVCKRIYKFSPTGYNEANAPPASSDPFYGEMEKWGADFDQRYQSECPDDTCRTGLNFVRQGTIWGGEHKHDADPAVTMATLAPSFAEADKQAHTIVNEGQSRQTANAANSFGVLLQAIWSPRCSDTQCYKDIKGVVFFYALEMNAYQKQHPDMGTHEVLVTVMPKFGPAFQDVIDKSKARADAEAAWQAAHTTP